MTTFLTKLFNRRRPHCRGWAVFQGMHIICVQDTRRKAEKYAKRCEWRAKEPHTYFVSKIKMYEI